jgi:stage III sporulation protein AA
MLEIFDFFSKKISQILKEELVDKPMEEINTLEEIRIRSNGNITLKFSDKQEILSKKITYKDILETLQIMCDNSIYSYQNEIKNGYITVKGGHRVGITGNCVIENEKVININYISSINFRIAREIIGCGNKALPYILKIKENTIYNTLIISPPGAR